MKEKSSFLTIESGSNHVPNMLKENHDVVKTCQSAPPVSSPSTAAATGEVPAVLDGHVQRQAVAGLLQPNKRELKAAKITVNISSNVYNNTTGGLIINQEGAVTIMTRTAT